MRGTHSQRLFVAITCAIFAAAIGLADADEIVRHVRAVHERLPLVVTVNVTAGWLAWRLGTVTTGGATAGAVVGLLILSGLGWNAWFLLGAGLALTAFTTHLGWAAKQRAGLAEPRGGRRAMGNIVANAGVAGAAAIVAMGTTHAELAAVAAATAIIASVSDTVASEVGQAWGGRPRLITSLRRVPAGTPGAVSVVGVSTGAASAVGLSAFAWLTGLVNLEAAAAMAASAVVASTSEGVLAIAIEARGWLDNNGVNQVSALLASAMAATACAWFQIAR